MKKLLVFDCFGVLYEEVAPRLFAKYVSKEKVNEILARDFPSLDMGDKDFDDFYPSWSEELGVSVEELKARWAEMFMPKEATFDRIKSLQDEYDSIILSNAPNGVVERLFANNGKADLFKRIFVSSAIKLIKPNRDIYEYVENQFKGQYASFTMIDDKEKNLVEPRLMGWKTIHFIDPEVLDVLKNPAKTN